jgi:hypothetical protein
LDFKILPENFQENKSEKQLERNYAEVFISNSKPLTFSICLIMLEFSNIDIIINLA